MTANGVHAGMFMRVLMVQGRKSLRIGSLITGELPGTLTGPTYLLLNIELTFDHDELPKRNLALLLN